MAKRTTTKSGAVKRTRKTAPRKTARRTATKPVGAEATTTAVAAPGVARPPEPTTEEIAERAYFLSLERKGTGRPARRLVAGGARVAERLHPRVSAAGLRQASHSSG